MRTVIDSLEERAAAVGQRLRQLATERERLAREVAALRDRLADSASEDSASRSEAAVAAWRTRVRSAAASLLEAASELRAE